MPKILVADDNTNIQKMVSLALEERGINVVSVGNGEAAVRRMPDLEPDLVLADIFMPVRNGYEVCEFVKKDERFAHVPVILLVGAFDPLDEKEARRVGADGVLKKPFVPPDPLIAMVTSALEKNPRVAAEMAKAKEAKLPPEPEPLPDIDLSSRPEPKPLPEFPEPSPEEAALLYGMGKGQRSLDSDDQVDGENSGPVAVPRAQDSDDDEAEAESSNDWRRSAMNIEIPAELAGKPAMASMDDLEPISFPSEKEYPPRRVIAPEPKAEAEKPPETQRPAEALPSSSTSFSLREVEDDEPQPEQEIAAGTIDFPETSIHSALDSEPHAHALPEPNSTAAGGHWLDAVASAQASQPTADWMQALNSQRPEPSLQREPRATERSAEDARVTRKAPEPAEWPVPDVSSSVADSFAEAQGQHEERQPEISVADSFFAEDTEHEAAEPAHESDDASALAPAIEFDAADSEPPLSFQDPALIQPPAVHVKPEPLLVEDESGSPAQYGIAAEETSPLHSFLSSAPEIAAPTTEAQSDESAPASEFFVNSASEDGNSAAQEDERIPTMAPPSREALSHIPFLTPPPSFLAELNSTAPQESRGPDPETVDTVVQKVFEKLQPQLQELLSQGLLKPLVENILQSEIKKR